MTILEILKKDKPYNIIQELFESNKLFEISPELIELSKTDVGHKNNFYHTLEVLKNVCDKNYDYKMRLVALFHDIGKPHSKRKLNNKWTFHNHEFLSAKLTLEIFDRLNYNDETIRNYVFNMIKYHGRVKMHRDVSESAIRRLDKDVGCDIIFDLINFCKCDLTTKFKDKKERIISGLDTIKNRIIEVREKDEKSKWRSPITGHDIMNILNIETGKLIGEIKKITDSKIKSGEWSVDDAINYIKTRKPQ